uniref:RING-type domain-containing protein n=1 Tax=Aegilops tauschii subsp. strangulata TaxID=200361 RepID=A0A453BIY0_AEGTS
MAVNCLYVVAASTAASAAALQWWAASFLDAPRDGDVGGGDWLETSLRSHVTVALLANLAAHVLLVLLLALKTLFFVRLTSTETRKVLEHIINYVIYKSIMVHGFQLLDIWQRHLMDSGVDYLDFQKTYKQAAGSFSEWRGQLIRNFGFVIDLISLLMSLGHYSMIFWLRGMAFHLVDAVLLLNLRALVVSFLKRIKTYIKLRKALRSLDGALPDAKYDEICTYDDECAICRGPMARAKKLPCNHLFHLPCLRSWLDQGLMEGYSCPTCRRPLFLSAQGHSRSTTAEVANVQLISEQLNMGLNQQRVPEQQDPSDGVWRGAGLDSRWAPPWSSTGVDDPSSSSAVRSVGLSGVQMMMRQFASVTDNYGHADATWNLWPESMAGPSIVPSSSSRPDVAS